MKYLLFLFLLAVGSCSRDYPDRQTLINEVKEAESSFARMAADSGIAIAFTRFADDSAILMRNNILIAGKEAIAEQYGKSDLSNVSLTWTPDFIDVSSSGDLAYTYGKYYYMMVRGSNDTLVSSGIFHTVWKKQTDGTWKYVWD